MYMYLPAYGWFSCHPFSVAWAEKHEGGGISSAAINEALVAHKLKADATDPKALEGGIAKLQQDVARIFRVRILRSEAHTAKWNELRSQTAKSCTVL